MSEHQICPLLEPPASSDVLHFFKNKLPTGLEVRIDADSKGKGLFTTQAVAAGDVVLRDPPLVGIQHTNNFPMAHVCARCFQHIGGINLQLANNFAAETEVEEEDIASLQTMKLPLQENFSLPGPVACQGGCYEAAYCSQTCASLAWEGHHRLLCCGRDAGPGSRAMADFNDHADSTNDVFRLAAQAVATILLSAQTELARLSFHGKFLGEDVEWQALQKAWLPFSMGYKRVWWECVAVPDDVSDEADFRQQIQQLAADSLARLSKALKARAPRPVGAFPAVLDLRVWGSIIGMFELNNLSMYVQSPVPDWASAVAELPAAAWPSSTAPLVTMVRDWLVEADVEDWCCEGNAFYSVQSCINHSCAPNAHAFKRECDIDGQAVILALQDIKAGEEITISYIDEEGNVAERQAALADYGFVCQCPKCTAEAAADS